MLRYGLHQGFFQIGLVLSQTREFLSSVGNFPISRGFPSSTITESGFPRIIASPNGPEMPEYRGS